MVVSYFILGQRLASTLQHTTLSTQPEWSKRKNRRNIAMISMKMTTYKQQLKYNEVMKYIDENFTELQLEKLKDRQWHKWV